ncbi:hypothetical protein AB7008_31835 [Bradyrhizobium sp. 521_C7_N1_3]|uniref:hypothetical protein n=1 Tax=Bradyrhizobium sp. 521_C7_N1_3 TaxID=3240368 RepID=UPI003F8AF364
MNKLDSSDDAPPAACLLLRSCRDDFRQLEISPAGGPETPVPVAFRWERGEDSVVPDGAVSLIDCELMEPLRSAPH